MFLSTTLISKFEQVKEIFPVSVSFVYEKDWADDCLFLTVNFIPSMSTVFVSLEAKSTEPDIVFSD